MDKSKKSTKIKGRKDDWATYRVGFIQHVDFP